MIKHVIDSATTTFYNIDDCRAVSLEGADFAECLEKGPNSCSYALPFGYCFLCQHPRLSEIIENTKQASSARISRE